MKNSNIRLNKLIFYVSYTLIIFSTMFKQVTGINNLLETLSTIGIMLLLINCVSNINKLNINKVLILFISVLMAVITKITSKSNTIFILILLIIAAKNIKLEELIKYDLKIKIPFMIIIVVLYFLGMTDVNLHYRNGIIRHSMGFSNPNVFSTYILAIIVEYLYLRRKKVNAKDLIIIIIGIFIIDFYADSRTQIFCLIILALIVYINKYTGKKFLNNSIVNFIVSNIFIILTIFSLLIIYFYGQGNDIVQDIDVQTSGRIKQISGVFNEYDVNLFGNKLDLVTSLQAKLTGKQQTALDNVYIYSLLSYGIIPFIIMCIAMKKYMKTTIKENEDILRTIMLVFLIGGLMERFCIEVQYNIFLLYFSYIIYDNKNKKEKVLEE
jgi:hypothetical protein